MRIGAKELRNKIAAIKPLRRSRAKPFKPIGFGLWAGRDDLKDVEKWLDEKRALKSRR